MAHEAPLSRFGRIYIPAVIATGLIVVLSCVYQLYRGPVPQQWFLLAALTLVSGSATVRLPSSHASISISEVFVFIAILLYGPSAGTVIVALDGLVISFWLAKRHREPRRAFFNMSAPAISAWCSAHLFFLTSGLAPLAAQAATLNRVLPSLAVSAFAYFALNTWLITLAIASEQDVNPLQLWISKFLWLSLNYFFGASVAVLVVSYNRTLDVGFIGVIVPLLLVLYFTFRSTIARVDDADRHVEELNTLYLSTIETLAMAIDAKDQVTHGHIRRVQNYAVGLARFAGVTDQRQIKAIEAAALLHDMGKLAVPEYILNKPGKLTPAEFEKMKLHASVGADILSAIAFPYPVVPIVRYHHEAWDGSGYPQGLRGTDIPIGARILAVVDCFDALTSDRPYRPRLSDEEALKILLDRRSSMYDPLIVDTFVKVYKQIAPDAVPLSQSAAALSEIASSTSSNATPTSPPSGFDNITASGDEMLTLYEIAGALGGQASIANTGDAVAKHLRRLVPFSLLVLYVYDLETDDLEARHAVGEAAPVVKGMRISLGQRLSGWVGANRQTIMNSDPVLDLGDMARTMSPRLRNCLSSPLLSNDALVGVLTLYSAGPETFNEDHRRIIEAVARQTAHPLKRAVDSDVSVGRDLLTLLPNFSQLEQLANTGDQSTIFRDSFLTLMLIDVIGLKRVNIEYGRSAGDEVLRHVARSVRAEIHLPDILFRYRSDEFLALLHSEDARAVDAFSRRITETIRQNQLVLQTGTAITVDIAVTCVSAPQDGRSLRDLLAAVRIPLPAPITPQGSRVH